MENFPNSKKVYKAGVVDMSKLAEAQVKDVADSRMTESKEDRSKNWIIRTGKRIWKHNIAQEWYRQREIDRVRKEISESGNLYAGETKDTTIQDYEKAKKAVVERFISEYEDEMLKQEEKESKKTVTDEKTKESIKNLIKEFAGNPAMSEAAFTEKQNLILSGSNPEYAQKGKMYASNLVEIAKEVRNSALHGEKLTEMDFDVEITLGEAKESLNTTAKGNTFDKIIEKTQNSKIGKYLFNEPAGIAIAAGLYAAGNFLGMKVLRSKLAKIGTFGATALLAGGISAAKESARLERERAQHIRESAKGMQFKESDMKRRQEMEGNRYETKNAEEIIKNLERDLTKISNGKINEAELNAVLVNLSDLEARTKMGDKEKVDLVGYSRFNKVEEERMNLDLLRAKIKVGIRKGIEEGRIEFNKGENFDNYLQQLVNVQSEGITTDIEQKNKIFKEMKVKKVAKAFVKTALIGAGVGAAFQEVKSWFDSETDGLAEGIAKHFKSGENNLASKATAFEGLRRWFTGDNPRLPMGHLHEFTIGDNHMVLPEGVSMVPNGDGTFNVLRGSDIISHNFKPEFITSGDHVGNLTEASQAILNKDDIYTNYNPINIHEHFQTHTNAEEYMNKHPEMTTKVHFQHMGNNTEMHGRDPITGKWILEKDPVTGKMGSGADLNEIRTQMGGINGTGIDKDGNYVLNLQHLKDDGSYQDGLPPVMANDEMKKGGLTVLMSLTKGTQHMVFKVPVIDGIAKIDPKSEIGQMMWHTENGRAVFDGAFAQVAHANGIAEDGGTNMQILGTLEGRGHPGQVIEDVIKDKTIGTVKLNAPAAWDWEMPPIIPIGARRPLERGEYEKVGGIYDESYLEKENIYENPTYIDSLLAGGTYDESYLDRDSIYEDPKYTEEPTETSYKNEIGKEVEDKKDTLDKQVVEKYINEMKNYIEQKMDIGTIKKLNEQIGEPMGNNTKISIVLPCYHEAENIYKTLSDWTIKQKDLNPEELEIITFVNAPKKNQPLDEKTIAEITRFTTEHPEYKIKLIKHNFDFKSTKKMGAVYKLPTDLAVFRNMQRLENGASVDRVANHLLRAGGADALGRNPKFLRDIIDFMEKHQTTEQLRTQSAYPPEVRKKFPLFNLVTVFNHSLSALYTRENSNIGLGTFRARAYAEVAGFDPNRDYREEIDLSMRIRNKLSKNKDALNKMVKKNAIDNPRRELFALARGETVLHAYTGFSNSERDVALREFDWTKKMPTNFRKNIELNPENMNREFDAYFQHFVGKTSKESGIISQILSGELNTKTATSPSVNPETRLVLQNPKIAEFMREIEEKRKNGEDTTRNSIEIKKISQYITEQLFDRILTLAFGFKKGEEGDYNYRKSTNGNVHIVFNPSVIKKINKEAGEKWENFNGYWKDGEEKEISKKKKTKKVIRKKNL